MHAVIPRKRKAKIGKGCYISKKYSEILTKIDKLRNIDELSPFFDNFNVVLAINFVKRVKKS